MEFENKTSETIICRTGGTGAYGWKKVRPNDKVELPEDVGVDHGLTPVIKAMKSKVHDNTVVETKQVSEVVKKKRRKELFQKNLRSIKGIGEKTSKDIMNLYDSEEALEKAILSGDSIPFRDDIVAKLIQEYGG